MVLWSTKENQIRLKVEGGKNDFSLLFTTVTWADAVGSLSLG